ncbi:Mss4-like protein [Aspergillus venezuelensis]
MSSYQGHCICGSIKLSLKEQPVNSLRCYCANCARSGGGSSINYVVDEPECTIEDTKSSLKTFQDSETNSGNTVERQFCGNCGSPVVTRSPKFPGKALIKASLFNTIAPPSMEVFTARREKWQPAVEGAQQA